MLCSKCGTEYDGNFCPQCGTPFKGENDVAEQKYYCTNCGEPTSRRVCRKCGVQNNRLHKFCKFCGAPINENATVCVNCQEPVRSGALVRAFAIISCCLTPGWLIVVIAGSGKIQYGLIALLAGIIMFLLALPFGTNAVIRFTRKRRWIRVPIYLLCFILALVLSITPVVLDAKDDTPGQTTQQSSKEESLSDIAIKAAEIVLENRLKNPASLVVHNADASIVGFDEDDNPKYAVELDYSAQNGFGGMNRETYTVILVYKIDKGAFYYGNAKINID